MYPKCVFAQTNTRSPVPLFVPCPRFYLLIRYSALPCFALTLPYPALPSPTLPYPTLSAIILILETASVRKHPQTPTEIPTIRHPEPIKPPQHLLQPSQTEPSLGNKEESPERNFFSVHSNSNSNTVFYNTLYFCI